MASQGIAHKRSDHLALEASAGLALACPYSSSAEFEAAIIDERRAAGMYGRPTRQRNLFVAFALAILFGLIFLTAI
ncbi:MAG: hypothetical protein HY659_05765 [Rhizobiales bacterium]|nr:hypothetical protein [Hyphomicrobiales bacterium]